MQKSTEWPSGPRPRHMMSRSCRSSPTSIKSPLLQTSPPGLQTGGTYGKAGDPWSSVVGRISAVCPWKRKQSPNGSSLSVSRSGWMDQEMPLSVTRATTVCILRGDCESDGDPLSQRYGILPSHGLKQLRLTQPVVAVVITGAFC